MSEEQLYQEIEGAENLMLWARLPRPVMSEQGNAYTIDYALYDFRIELRDDIATALNFEVADVIRAMCDGGVEPDGKHLRRQNTDGTYMFVRIERMRPVRGSRH